LTDRLLILPCAGFGTRVGQPEAKELLPRPVSAQLAGRPMIDLGLQLAASAGAVAHVITREEKKSLLNYLEIYEKSSSVQGAPCEIQVQLVSPTREWPETLLKSKPYWRKWNLVVLPDTDFSPLGVVKEMFSVLAAGHAPCVFATFAADNCKTWGVVDAVSGQHCEKPVEWSATTRAWGLFGFHYDVGEMLLAQMLESTFDHKWRDLPKRTAYVPLADFCDLTRGG